MKNVLDKFRNILAIFAAGIFAVIFLLVVAEIFCRSFFGFSLLWVTDFIQIIVCWMLAFGMSAIVYTNDHLKIDFLIQKLPEKGQKVIAIITDVLELAFFALLVPYGIKTAVTKMSIAFTTLRWPMGYMYAALPVFGALCTIFMLYRLYAAVSGLKGNG